MESAPAGSLLAFLSQVPDPRGAKGTRHPPTHGDACCRRVRYAARFRRTLRSKLGFVFSPKYQNGELRKALEATFGQQKLFECRTRVAVPTYCLANDDIRVFRTPHRGIKDDAATLAWKVGLATSAAPSFFPSCRDIDDSRLIDGGVWANNPSLLGIAEAIEKCDAQLQDIRVLSIGTFDPVAPRTTKLDNGGLLAWAKSGNAVEILMRAQSLGVTDQARGLLGKDEFGRDRVVRINPAVPAGQFKLDRPERIRDALAKASHLARTTLDQLSPFFECPARDTTPWTSLSWFSGNRNS